MSSIVERLVKIKDTLPPDVVLVAVSKYHPCDEILSAYGAGQWVFGENIVQELRGKYESLPKDIEWHFIGHLQRNKVKYIAPFVSMIHSVDSLDLLREIDRQAAKYNRVIPCLLQIHVAQEETKFGFSPEECTQMLLEGTWRKLGHVRLCGIMGMATNTDDVEQVRREFRFLKNYFNELKTAFFQDDAMFSCRSWGMSDDYRIALSEGSNMVRVGSRIFGPRPLRQQ